MSNASAIEAYREFHESVTDTYTRIVGSVMDDEDGWVRVGEALTELRQSLSMRSAQKD